MQKKKKQQQQPSTNAIKDANENMLLEYMEDVDDKLFKKDSNGKNLTVL